VADDVVRPRNGEAQMTQKPDGAFLEYGPSPPLHAMRIGKLVFLRGMGISRRCNDLDFQTANLDFKGAWATNGSEDEAWSHYA